MEVRDGLLYASYLNDGLVILDVGNGIKGGSPSNPQLVSQYKYDLVALRAVPEAGGTQVIGGTHTAWRYKNYVFVGDEILPFGPPRSTQAGIELPDDLFETRELAGLDDSTGDQHDA